MSCADLFLALIAILFPPIAVWIKCGLCTADSFINIALCCLGYLPGLIHAWYIISLHPERDYDYEPIADSECGERVTYVYVAHNQGQPHYGTQQPSKPNKANKPVPPPPSSAVAGPSVGAGGDEAGAPPSYSEVVKGDNKVQSQD